ncbi:MAG: toll/interleukin-1 receptor domain-containing protein [Chloroflexi bacterium]|nr:toll/interleukin-1 receptor domain-containing protein [Chloroflexota bacterium]
MTLAFISYGRGNQRDRELADWMRQWLHDNGFQAWMDVYDLPPNVHRDDAIEQGLRGADIVIGLLSPGSAEDDEAKNEWAWAQDKGKFQLVTVHEAKVPHRFGRTNIIDVSNNDPAEWERLRKVLLNPPEPHPSTATPRPIPHQSQRPQQPPRQSQSVFDMFTGYLNQANIIPPPERAAQFPAWRSNPAIMWTLIGTAGFILLCCTCFMCSSLSSY